MSTFLELAAKLRQNIRANGTGPTTVALQTGELKRIVDWVSDAYFDLQNKNPNWRWLRSTFTFNTVASTDSYAYGSVTDSRLNAVISRFARWITHDDEGCPIMKAYLTSAGVGGEQWLKYVPWAEFRAFYKFGSQQTVTGPPDFFTISPQEKLFLGPNPDAIYTVSGEYQMSPQRLAIDADEPEMPARFHDLIMYLAMEKAATDGVAIERMERATTEGGRLMRALEFSQLPEISMAGPLT